MIQIPEYHDGFVIRIEGSMVKIITIIHYIHSSFGELDIDISIWDGDEVGNDAKWGSILLHLEPLHNLCHHHVQLHLGKPPANAGPEQKSSVHCTKRASHSYFASQPCSVAPRYVCKRVG